MPGYQHVDKLAEYLVELRSQSALCLSNSQANTIIALWKSLDEHDKKRVVFAARHQERLLSGRFRVPKKPSKTPGVESATRCMLGASSAPAQWPDCCRLVKIIRLCDIHPGPVRKGKGAESRWSLILRDYHKIRQLVLGNFLVMQGTELQMVHVNQTTLIQWHNNRQKKQDLSVVVQGSALPPALPESEEPLQEARVLPAAPMPAHQEHQYRLPESTAGQAQQRPKASGQPPRPILPKGQQKRPLSLTPPGPGPYWTPQFLSTVGQTVTMVPVVFPGPAQQVTNPQATMVPVVYPGPAQQGTNPQATTAQAGATPKRPYRRNVQANTCKKCGQFRTGETGHSQYRGRVYCPASESLTKEQWLEEMRKKLP